MKRSSERLAFWRQAVAQQQGSGRSIRAFCQERGLTEHSFYAWRKRVKHQGPATFALVECGAGGDQPLATVELVLTTGERWRVPCEAAAVRVVLSVLREARG